MNNLTHLKRQKPLIYQRFRDFYKNYGQINIDNLSEIYADDIVFKDPLHTIKSISRIKSYFQKMSNNLLSCEFEFIDEIVTDQSAHITWDMHFSHASIAKGKKKTLRGMSLIKYEQKIYYHEDIYDLGAMIYEHLPIMGKLTTFIKGRIGK